MCTIAGRMNYSKADMITLGRNNAGINLKLTLKKGPIMLGHSLALVTLPVLLSNIGINLLFVSIRTI